MKSMHRVRWLVAIGAVALLGGAFSGVASGSGSQANQRFIVVAKNAADYASLRARAVQSGARITKDLKRINSFAVWASPSLRRSLASDSRTAGIAADRLVKIAPPEAGKISMPTSLARQHAIRISAPASAAAAPAGKVRPDPAFRFHDAEWDYRRIGLPDAWGTTLGSPHVTVAVADTGLDYTHPELKGRISNVVDFTSQEFPPICKTLFGESDQDLAAQYGGPVDGDWNGHGSWIGGDIGGALDGTGINGIAPRVDLVSLKISQWCGYATDSELISAFLYAADHKYDAVSISFGGYLYRPDPGQD